MSLLETVPTEIFQKVASYLAFFDKKSLQLASKKCLISLRQFKAPDKLSWIVHMCLVVERQPQYRQVILSHGMDCEELNPPETYYKNDYYTFKSWLLDFRLIHEIKELDLRLQAYYHKFEGLEGVGWDYEQGSIYDETVSDTASPTTSPIDVEEPILFNYFEEPSPFGTLAYFYLLTIQRYYKSKVHNDDHYRSHSWSSFESELMDRLEKLKINHALIHEHLQRGDRNLESESEQSGEELESDEGSSETTEQESTSLNGLPEDVSDNEGGSEEVGPSTE